MSKCLLPSSPQRDARSWSSSASSISGDVCAWSETSDLVWAQDLGGGGNDLAMALMEPEGQMCSTEDMGEAPQGAGPACSFGVDPLAEESEVMAEVIAEAMYSIPSEVAEVDVETRMCVEIAVEAAARSAFGACLKVALANEPGGQCSEADGEDRPPSPAVLQDALARYCSGPGVAVLRFGDYLNEVRGYCPVEGVEQEASSEQVLRALEIYEGRMGVSREAYAVQTNPDIALASGHVSGQVDHATPSDNIQDMVEGDLPDRSAYQGGPGGEVEMSSQTLTALNALASPPYGFKLHVSELTGGKHSGGKKEVEKGKGSRHYHGEAFDVDLINGKVANASNKDTVRLMSACQELGATLVLGPGDAGHDTHVHAEWQ